MAKAEAADQADVPDGMSIPEELAWREARLAKLAAARATIEARAKERFEREQAEHQAKLAARDAKTAATGKKPGGKPPQPPVEGPLPTDQVNLTDEESRIMPVPHSDTLGVRQPNAKVAGGGFEQCYNAQAVVAADSLLVVATDVVQAPNDKQQLHPMLNRPRPNSRVTRGHLGWEGDKNRRNPSFAANLRSSAIRPDPTGFRHFLCRISL
jgi:hypothetical protein